MRCIYQNEHPRYGRAQRGSRVRVVAKHGDRKFTVHVFMKVDRVLYWEVSSANANDAEVLRVAKAAAQRRGDNDSLLRDRLGTTRRVRNPSMQHLNPEALEAIRGVLGVTIHMPFKGKRIHVLQLSDL